jgi:hypothetical protein
MVGVTPEFVELDTSGSYLITPDMISSLPNASPNFLAWAENALGTGDLVMLATKAIRTHIVSGVLEALVLFNEICSGGGQLQLALCDLGGKNNACYRCRRKVNSMFGDNNPVVVKPDNHRIYGICGHMVAPELARKAIPKAAPQQNLLLPMDTDIIIPETFVLREKVAARPIEKVSKQHLHDVYELWTNLCQVSQRVEALKNLDDLRRVLEPFFSDYIGKIKNGYYSWFEFQTSKTWAAWLIRSVHEEPWYIFTEIPAMDKRWGIPAGRIDAIRVVSINEKPPTFEQGQKLQAMARCRFESVGWLVVALTCEFGPNIVLELVDWKFAVGDHHDNREIKVDDVLMKPLSNHRLQMERYLTAAMMDATLARNTFDGLSTNLKMLARKSRKYNYHCDFFESGSLYYLFPDYTDPLIHRIKTSNKDRCASLGQMIAKIPDAQNHATIRGCYNRISSHLVTEISKTKKKRQKDSSLLLFTE